MKSEPRPRVEPQLTSLEKCQINSIIRNTHLLNFWGWGRGFLFHRRWLLAFLADWLAGLRLVARQARRGEEARLVLGTIINSIVNVVSTIINIIVINIVSIINTTIINSPFPRPAGSPGRAGCPREGQTATKESCLNPTKFARFCTYIIPYYNIP